MAVNLLSAQAVVMRRGSLADARRAADLIDEGYVLLKSCATNGCHSPSASRSSTRGVAPARRVAGCQRSGAGHRHRGGLGSQSDGDLAAHARRRARSRLARAGTRQALRATVGAGSELRLDGTIGSDPSLAIELYRPIGPTPLFVAPYAGVGTVTFNLIEDDAVIARYKQTVARTGLNAGVNLGARSDLRIGPYLGRTTASIDVGDPGFPELRGKERGAELVWRLDTQDGPVVPAGGLLSQVRLSRVFNGPDVAIGEDA